jgi:hypothetical protein
MLSTLVLNLTLYFSFNIAFGGVFGGRVLPVFVGLSSFGFVGVSIFNINQLAGIIFHSACIKKTHACVGYHILWFPSHIGNSTPRIPSI